MNAVRFRWSGRQDSTPIALDTMAMRYIKGELNAIVK